MPQNSKATLKNMLDNPLAYVSLEQKRRFVIAVVRRAVIFIAIGAGIGIFDLVLFSNGVNIADGFDDSTFANIRASTPVVIWYGAMFLCPAYGIYLLATLKKHAARLAADELTKLMPELAEMRNHRTRTAYQKFDRRVTSVDRAVTVTFASLIILFMAVMIATIAVLALRSQF